jgi:hypothetical protein
MADVRLELAQEELHNIENGYQPIYKISASKFLHMGLEIEEQQ